MEVIQSVIGNGLTPLEKSIDEMVEYDEDNKHVT
jgi:hypothetical protein